MDEKIRGYIALLGRIFLVLIFVLSGFNKISNPQATQQYMGAMGMPMTGLFLIGAIFLELVGAASLLLGYWTRLGATMLIIFMIPTTLIFHTNFSDPVQFIMFMKNLSMTGGLLVVLALGPGKLSLDGRGAT
jgi:putative oxidoreductase